MILIQITTKTDYYPTWSAPGHDSPKQDMIAALGDALPTLFVMNIADLHMDPNTSEPAIRVTHHKFHIRDVNAPDMWILVEFSEGGLDETEKSDVTTRLQKLLLNWLQGHTPELLDTDLVCQVRWSPSHGFLKIGDTVAEW